MTEIKRLLEPIQIASFWLKNRMVMAPMGTIYCNINGYVSEGHIHYYEARAKGGVGMICTEGTDVAGTQSPMSRNASLSTNGHIGPWKRVVEAVHRHGVPIEVQLNHSGRQILPNLDQGVRDVVAPSAVPVKVTGVIPRALELDEIDDLVSAFGDAATRAREAGFDMVNVHAAHGYLIEEFLSPATNKRTDRYGGNLENRVRFLLEIIENIRKKAGTDYPISIRISADEYLEGGLKVEDSIEICKRLEKVGVALIKVSGGGGYDQALPMVIPPSPISRAVHAPNAARIKPHLKVPISVAGRINDPVVAEEIIAKGMADLVDLGRALRADPDFPRKVTEGRLEDVRMCIACNQGGTERGQALPRTCTVNPQYFMEPQWVIRPAEKSKEVLVLGGGPAGLEAAMIAAQRGHKVTIIEKQDRLGGQFYLAALPPGKGEFLNFINYATTQLKKLRVKVELGVEATVDEVKRRQPDAVIVAVGAKKKMPTLPGQNRHKQVTSPEAVLAGATKLGRRVLFIGGWRTCAETAELATDQGCQVAIIDEQLVGKDMGGATLRWFLRKRLREKGVRMLAPAKLVEITETGAVIEHQGGRETIDADTIVVAQEEHPNRDLWRQLKGQIPEVLGAGDCLEPRNAMIAINEGFRLALDL